MRVVVNDVGEFFESLVDVTGLFDSTIRVSISRMVVVEGVKYSVRIQASAVVQTSEGAEYLLDVGEVCGTDYCDASQDYSGSRVAQEKKKQIKEFASSKGWRVLPGVISE